ncbi:tyrosine--tRNA ligase [bacterium]|nr:tyrosine--tRNA ligase [candidate division CSSED10-310 bacterium]
MHGRSDVAGLVEHLNDRGFIHQISDPGLERMLEQQRTACYAGFDPSDSSLHLGHLIPIIGLMHFQRYGHRPIAVIGGATGMIGDPSGRDRERTLMSIDLIRSHERSIQRQLEHFLNFDDTETGAIMVNNYDWTHPYSYLDFLREIGKHFSVNTMISKESVRMRLESRDQGISYTEFSYQILQAFDFHHLWKTNGCKVQIGGSDQWGNITAGIDLNRRLGGEQLYGITFPLLMTASGRKFGKSEGNAVWLDPIRTKPYELFQYFIQTDDKDVIRFLKLFTFLDLKEIAELEILVRDEPQTREAQKILASEVTRLIHGEAGLQTADGSTRILFGDEPICNYTDSILNRVFSDTPSGNLPKEHLEQDLTVVNAMVASGMCGSKGEARRLVSSGGFYINNIRETDPTRILTVNDLASDTIMVLRSGKKRYFIIRFSG